jgi:CSLREA domain-containing protein
MKMKKKFTFPPIHFDLSNQIWLLYRILVLVVLLAALLVGSEPLPEARAGSWTVDSVADDPDDNPGDGNCETALGKCTLRAAIQEANDVSAGTSTISFNIPGSTPHTITLKSALETISKPVYINGYSEPDSNSSSLSPSVIVVPGGGSPPAVGFNITGGNSTISGMVISGFSTTAIQISNNGGNTILGNLVGPDGPSGDSRYPGGDNGIGVSITESGSNIIGGTGSGERNLISGNGIGVSIVGSSPNYNATANVIQGNYIGTKKDGKWTILGNTGDGIVVQSAPSTIIGGTSAGAGNVIAANGGDGIQISGNRSGGTNVQGNIIGLNVNGKNITKNDGYGINLSSTKNITIGGTSSNARNIISGNGMAGIYLGTNADNNTVQGNYIGTDDNGSFDSGNSLQGVLVSSGDNNTIGGTSSGAGNTISGNGDNGIEVINADGAVIQGNRIGIYATSVLGLANDENGVSVTNSTNTLIGGDTPSAGNIIRSNSKNGVVIVSGSANAILRNMIDRNDGLGIDLGDNGVTNNDNESDGFQNFPVISSAYLDGSTLTLQGTLSSKGGTTYRLEYFVNNSILCDPSGNGEGKTYIGNTEVTTTGGGNASYDIDLAVSGVAAGNIVTATATVLTGSDYEETSEFSTCAVITDSLPPSAGVFVVNSTGDSSDADTNDSSCDTGGTVDGVAECTLRAAIQQANTNPTSDQYSIFFNISGFRPHTISPASALPSITKPVIIDGTSEPNYGENGDPVVELDGSNITSSIGLNITAGNSVVKGLVINNFSSGYGIQLSISGSNIIESNYIGSNEDGTTDQGNLIGIYILNVSGNTIGGSSSSTRNLISGNNNYGIQVENTNATDNRISGNYVGVSATGTALGNGTGIYIHNASDNTIGGTSLGERNVISGNNSYGIRISGSDAQGNLVYGNYIGTSTSGSNAVPNLDDGVHIDSSANNNYIGGAGSGEGNLISGNNGDGIEINGALTKFNRVFGNLIGTKNNGSTNMGNNVNGVLLQNNAKSNYIGDTSISNSGNTIAYNNGDGISVGSGTNNLLTGNSIFSNNGLGIDLGPNYLTENDNGDSDTGANNLQNFPVISEAGSGSTYIVGTLNSKANTTYNLHFYSNPICDGPNNAGQGKVYLGEETLKTNGSGNASFSIWLSGTVSEGDFLIGTATDGFNNTSEFSRCKLVGTAPTLTPTPITPSLTPTKTLIPTRTRTPTKTRTPTGTYTPTTPTSTLTPGPSPTNTLPGGISYTQTGTITITTSPTTTVTPPTATLVWPLQTLTEMARPSNTVTGTPPMAMVTTTGGFVFETTPTSTITLTRTLPPDVGTSTPTITRTPAAETAGPGEGETILTEEAEAGGVTEADESGGGGISWLWFLIIPAVLLLAAGGAFELIRWLRSRQEPELDEIF